MWNYIYEYDYEDKRIQYEFIVSPEKNIYLLKRRVKESNSDFFILDKNYLENRNSNITKRIYFIIQCIQSLKVGKIRKYQVFYRLEIDVICKYLESKNISNQIVFKSFGAELQKMQYMNYINNAKDTNETFLTSSSTCYLDKVKSLINIKIYIIVYKGYIDIIKYKNILDISKEKFKIYLNN